MGRESSDDTGVAAIKADAITLADISRWRMGGHEKELQRRELPPKR
jgi:hypothetical protein